MDLAIGIAAALLTLAILRPMAAAKQRYLVGILLAVAALIYVVLALWGGREWLGLELVGLVGYSLLALLGVRLNPWFLASGWAQLHSFAEHHWSNPHDQVDHRSSSKVGWRCVERGFERRAQPLGAGRGSGSGSPGSGFRPRAARAPSRIALPGGRRPAAREGLGELGSALGDHQRAAGQRFVDPAAMSTGSRKIHANATLPSPSCAS